MKAAIQKEINGVTDALSFYPMNAEFSLLHEMNHSQTPIVFIGLIFDILLIMFIIVSILLIYSLLLISVETKTFDIGVMRLVGLSRMGFIAMIFTQAAFFVFPALFTGFICSFPCIKMIYTYLFTQEMGFQPTINPSMNASL